MTSVSNVNFTADVQNKKPKKDVVYVSKNPDAMVNATGVVAGTAGMVGGAIVGGGVGLAKLPGHLVKDVFQAPELTALADILKTAKSPEVAEELLEITKTMGTRLDEAFRNDPQAKAVVNKVFDPILHSISFRKNTLNIRYLIQKHLSSLVNPTKPVMLTEDEKWAAKMIKPLRNFANILLGTPNSHTSKAIGGLTGNIAEAISQTVENIKNFTPEEREAWGRVTNQIKLELQNNPKLRVTGGIAKSLKDVVNGFKGANRRLSFSPLKTIGIWSAIGAAGFGALSTLGWFGLKKGLMSKENEKAVKAGQV